MNVNDEEKYTQEMVARVDGYIFISVLVIIAILIVSQWSHFQNKKDNFAFEEIEQEWEWVKITAGDDDLCLSVIKDELVDPLKEYSDEYIWGLIISKNNWETKKINKGDEFFVPIDKEKKELIQELGHNPIFKTPDYVKY